MNKDKFDKIAAIVWEEIKKQDEKWGEDRQLEDGLWYRILGEEFGEVGQASLHDQFGGDHAGTLVDELKQTAAVSFQWVADVLERDGYYGWIPKVNKYPHNLPHFLHADQAIEFARGERKKIECYVNGHRMYVWPGGRKVLAVEADKDAKKMD